MILILASAVVLSASSEPELSSAEPSIESIEYGRLLFEEPAAAPPSSHHVALDGAYNVSRESLLSGWARGRYTYFFTPMIGITPSGTLYFNRFRGPMRSVATLLSEEGYRVRYYRPVAAGGVALTLVPLSGKLNLLGRSILPLELKASLGGGIVSHWFAKIRPELTWGMAIETPATDPIGYFLGLDGRLNDLTGHQFWLSAGLSMRF